MGEFCRLKYSFGSLLSFCFCFVLSACLLLLIFFITSVKSPIKNVMSLKAVMMNSRTFGWTTYRSSVIAEQSVFRAVKFLLCLWRSANEITSPELSHPENKGRAVPA